MTRELFFGRLGVLPWRRVALYTLAVVALAAATKASSLVRVVPHVPEDSHGQLSLSLAVNRAFCGAPSGLSTGEQLGTILFSDDTTIRQPVRQVIAARWGSTVRYCATVSTPYTNNENSLMLLENWAWRLAPDLSVLGVGRVLLAVKIGLFVFFVLVCLRLGVGVLVCFAILDAALALLVQLQPNSGYSAYSFLASIVMASIAIYPLMLSLSARRPWRHVAWPIVAGAWSAFFVNMRTSYLPICVALALLYVYALALERSDTPLPALRRAGRLAPTVLLWALGYTAFQYTFITRSTAGDMENLSRHTFFHPLVLSVGLPTNAFAEREGIEWDDVVGLQLAHRVNPSARYLSREYEQALETFYISLWKRFPREMIRVYFTKARLAGTEMLSRTDTADWLVRLPRSMLKHVPNGLCLLALVLGFSLVAWRQYLQRKRPGLLLMTMMGATATLLMLESMLILPRYFLTYHAPLLLLYCSITFLVIQVVCEWVVRSQPFGERPSAAPLRHLTL